MPNIIINQLQLSGPIGKLNRLLHNISLNNKLGTIWNPPDPIYDFLALTNPDINIEASYIDEYEDDTCGIFHYQFKDLIKIHRYEPSNAFIPDFSKKFRNALINNEYLGQDLLAERNFIHGKGRLL